MDIEEFVAATLVQIASGIKRANEQFREQDIDAHAVPRNRQKGMIWLNRHEVEFDIAVTAEQKSGKSGEGGIKVWSVGAQGGMSAESSHSTVSRIRFKIPMSLPQSWNNK